MKYTYHDGEVSVSCDITEEKLFELQRLLFAWMRQTGIWSAEQVYEDEDGQVTSMELVALMVKVMEIGVEHING